MGLNLFDVAVIVLYLASVTAFGMHFKKKQNTIKGYSTLSPRSTVRVCRLMPR